MIKAITFEQWRDAAFPNDPYVLSIGVFTRTKDVQYEIIEDYAETAVYLGYYVKRKLLAVVSGHKTGPSEYRSRGYWCSDTVSDKLERNAIWREMMEKIEVEARAHDAALLWATVSVDSMVTYEQIGFVKGSEEFIHDSRSHMVIAEKSLSDTVAKSGGPE